MKFLMDVNVLVAWGWQDHADHTKICRWIVRIRHHPVTPF